MVSRAIARAGAIAARLLLLITLALAVGRVVEQLAGRLAAAGDPGLADIERALRWDPTQPDFHLEAALRLTEKLELLDLERAESHLDEAVRLNPHEWLYRFERGRLLERQGRLDEAEKVLLDALAETPHHPIYRWRVANYFVRHGEAERALGHLEVALAGSRALLEPGFILLSRLEVAPERMAALWPRDPEASRVLFKRIVGSPPARVDAATEGVVRELWRRMESVERPRRIGDVALYQRFLMLHGALEEARTEWIDAARRLGWPTDDFEQGRDLVWNGGFELPLARGPLDWYAAEKGAVIARRFETAAASQGRSLLSLDFRDDASREFVSLSQQIVAVGSGGPWRLSVDLRSAGRPSAAGFVVELLALPERRSLFESAVVRPGASWIELSGRVDLEQVEGARLLLLRVRPSQSLSGRMSRDPLWLDDFRLTRIQPDD